MSKPWINGWNVCNVITELWISYAMAESPASIVICKNFHGLGTIMWATGQGDSVQETDTHLICL